MFFRLNKKQTKLFIYLFIFALSCCMAQQSKWEKLHTQYFQARDKGNHKMALAYAKEAYHIALKEAKEHYSPSCVYLGFAYNQIGNYIKAEKYLLQALNSYDSNDTSIPYVLGLLAKNYNDHGEYKKAEHYGLKALKLLDKKEQLRGGMLLIMGSIYQKQDKYDATEKMYKEAEFILKKDFDNNMVALAGLYSSWGLLYYTQGKYDHALRLSKQALEIDAKVRKQK